MKLLCVANDRARAQSGFRTDHGQAVLVETDQGRVLLDTGSSGGKLLYNLDLAGIDERSIDALVLSHAHDDHTGGVGALLKRTGRIPLYAHADILRERFSLGSILPSIVRRWLRLEAMRSRGLPVSREELERSAHMHLSADPQQVLPNVYTTGEITERPELEGRSQHHFVRGEAGWSPDPYRDDMSLVVRVAQGLVLVCGCCHAGLLNTLLSVRSSFGEPIHGVVGGLHLRDLSDAQLQHIVDVLRDYGAIRMFPNHCTGDRAVAALTHAFGARVTPFPAGAELVF
jgi:7,8-dihydropterin-6-yl-methyl-4-(beta-D-ribofuranosyl)aminobenzene 5'-phosphate synthase